MPAAARGRRPATVDPRFLVDAAKLDAIEAVVRRWWPEAIDPAALGNAALVRDVETAHERLLEALDLSGYLTVNHAS